MTAGSYEKYKQALLRMNPTEFETKVANILATTQDWEEPKVTSSSRDGGYDATAREGNTRIGMQMKRYRGSNKVGGPDIQQYVGVKAEYGFDLFVIACSTDFTDSAKQKASKFGIELVDGDHLAKLFAKVDSQAKERKREKRKQAEIARRTDWNSDPFKNTEFDPEASRRRRENAQERLAEARRKKKKRERREARTRRQKMRMWLNQERIEQRPAESYKRWVESMEVKKQQAKADEEAEPENAEGSDSFWEKVLRVF